MNLVRAQRLVPATPPKSWTLPRLEHQEMKPLSLKHPQSLLRKAKKGGVLVPRTSHWTLPVRTAGLQMGMH